MVSARRDFSDSTGTQPDSASHQSLHPVFPPLLIPTPSYHSLSTLSDLLGRLLRLIYGVFGVTRVADHELLSLRDDLRAWSSQLPDDLKFNGVWSSLPAGECAVEGLH